MNVVKVRGVIKNYDWGKLGLSSTVAQLEKAAFPDFVVDSNLPYAELWMGTHSSGPSTIASSQEKLIDFICCQTEVLGSNIAERFGESKGLPFLFKVLSVNKSLSIQVHPDKDTAEILHKKYPQYYPDDNHKPEMTIALTDFKLLCGFRPLEEIKLFLLDILQFQELVDKNVYAHFMSNCTEENLKKLFSAMMTCPADLYKKPLAEITENFEKNSYKGEHFSSIKEIFLKTANEFPGDVGLFCLFFFNYLKLNPGEAVFLAANEPHAYLYGDCVECMACSDNVVRAGLTPKFKDVQTLCEILTYKCRPAKENLFPFIKHPEDEYLKIYNPPVKEFSIDVISLPSSCQSYNLRSICSASLLLVIQGSASCNDDSVNGISRGSIIFVPSTTICHIKPSSEMIMFRAYCDQ